MRIEWVMLAEGVALDARGAMVAIGLNQNIFPAATMPVATKRAVLTHVVADAGVIQPNSKFTFSIRMRDPKGNVALAQTAAVSVGHIPWPSLPAITDLPLELALNLSEYGTYRFEVEIQPPEGGSLLTGHVEMYVVRPEDQVPAPGNSAVDPQ